MKQENAERDSEAQVIADNGWWVAHLKTIIWIFLVIIFIQFLVMMIAMTVALLRARPDVPVLGRHRGHNAFSRSFFFVIHLLMRVIRALARLGDSKPHF